MKIKSGQFWTELSNDDHSIVILYSHTVAVAVVMNKSVGGVIEKTKFTNQTRSQISDFFERNNLKHPDDPLERWAEVTRSDLDELVNAVTLNNVMVTELIANAEKFLKGFKSLVGDHAFEAHKLRESYSLIANVIAPRDPEVIPG